MILIIRLLILSIIDYLIIWFYVKQIDPDPSISIAIILLVPAVIVINLAIALLLHFIRRQFVKVFLVNSIISAILMNIIFTQRIREHQKIRFESWTFKTANRSFEITDGKLDHSFSMSERITSGSSIEFLQGNFIVKGNDYYLTTDSSKYVIRNSFLYGFRSKDSIIRLLKVE
ncbi:hypothetical protein [Hymenobacter nivis]|uniref:hypothetical protein n=1 Tax=Hymenobacter nivis TaxID=1850093 RepID=UPI0013A59BD6|nr:hypothetical protein [Hymenobacter nivis]